MTNLAEHVGKRIRYFRKSRGLTVEHLASKIHKSKATVYKYECGKIPIDIDTLSDISTALNIEVTHFFDLPYTKGHVHAKVSFFNTNCLFAYYYDGRSKQIVKSLLRFRPGTDDDLYHASFYMNLPDFTDLEKSRYIYSGTLSSHETVSYCILENITLPIETLIIQIVHPFQTSNSTWGLFLGLSDQPLAPMATKILLSRVQLSNQELNAYPLIFTKDELSRIRKQNAILLSIRD